MAMTLDDAATRLRYMIIEKTAAFYENAELFQYVSDARIEVAAETGFLTQLSTIPLSANKATYDLYAGTREILSMWWLSGAATSSYYDVMAVGDDEASAIYDTKQRQTGRPIRFIRRGLNQFELRPVPGTTAGVLKMQYSKIPAAVTLSATNLSDFPDEYMRWAVLPKAAQFAYQKTDNLQKANDFERQAQMGIQKIKKYTDRWQLKGKNVSQYPAEWDRARYTQHPLDSTLT